MKTLMISLCTFFALNATANDTTLPYCRAMITGTTGAASTLFMAEVTGLKYGGPMTGGVQIGDIKVDSIVSVNGGTLGANNNIQVDVVATDEKHEADGIASGDGHDGNVVFVDEILTRDRKAQNACFGQASEVMIACSYDQSKVDAFINQYLGMTDISHVLPKCP